VDGARELPLEGQEAMLSALATLIEIQDSENDRVWWDRFAQLIEETNPTLVATALEQFIKYYRGEPELVPGLVPLLDHPQVGIRQDAATLIGQVVQRNPEDHAIPDDGAVRAELVSRATRDDSALVRVAAIEALAAYPFELVDEVLEQISRNDPEQKVRYAAELIRMGQRQNGRAR
jgi:HEAT repeat protein